MQKLALWSSGSDSTLPLQGTQAWSLVGEWRAPHAAWKGQNTKLKKKKKSKAVYKDKTKSQHIIPYEFPSANQGDIWFSLDFSIGVWALESPRLYLGYMPIMLLFLIPVSEPQITLGSLTQTLPNFGPLICQQSSLCALSLCVSLPHAIVNATRVYQPLWEKHSFQYS